MPQKGQYTYDSEMMVRVAVRMTRAQVSSIRAEANLHSFCLSGMIRAMADDYIDQLATADSLPIVSSPTRRR